MKVRWLKKAISLFDVVDLTMRFFRKRSFEVSIRESAEKIEVFARKSGKEKLKVIINISGDPDCFTVEFLSPRMRSIEMLGPLLSLLSLGSVVMKQLQSLDKYEILERDFWAFLDREIEKLSGNINK